MKLLDLVNRLFLRLRGYSGPDLSRGPLSDLVRDAGVSMLLEHTGESCLEVGVGEGLLAEAVRDRGAFRRFIGVDISTGNLFLSKNRFAGDRFFAGVCASAHCLPLRPEGIERVVCVNTLYNQRTWDEVREIILELGRVTSVGGSFLFDIRNARDPLITTIYRTSRIIDPSTRKLEIHAYSYRRVKRMMEENGFSVRRRRAVYYPFWFIPSAYVIEAERVA
jgi:ubiquinone/menaquinone biosynthesis C-methylase UbiE